MDKWYPMLSAKLDYTVLPGYRPERYLIYRGSKIDINEAKFNEILGKIPEKYYNQKEKLTRFIVEKNDEGQLKYFSEYEIEVFDFRVREYTKKKREVILSEEECNELYLIFKEIYNSIVITSAENFYDDIFNAVKDVRVSSQKLIEIRDELLEESDKYMLPDFPISEEERAEWIEYRKELRDFTNQEAWPDDIENITFPVSPMPMEQAVKMFSEMELSQILSNQIDIDALRGQLMRNIKKYYSFTIKASIISSLTSMRIPLFVEQDMIPREIVELEDELTTILRDARYSEIMTDDYDEEIEDDTNKTDYSQALDMIEEKIDFINEKLAEHNVDFTIADLISDVIKDIPLHNEAQELVDSLED